MKYIVTGTIHHFTFHPYCPTCLHLPRAGDIMDSTPDGNLICPYCGFVFSPENSKHIKLNSREEKDFDKRYLEGKKVNLKEYPIIT